jgi:hypothetical protein
MNAAHIPCNTTHFLLIPSSSPDIVLHEAQAIASFTADYISLCDQYSLDLLEVFEYPAHPNRYDPVTIRTPETYETVHRLAQLIESPRVVPLDFVRKAADLCGSVTFDRGVFPKESNPGLAMIKFVCYFRSFLSRLPALANLLQAFSLEPAFFPDLIEAFTIEFIPSFVHHHNTLEKLGDGIVKVIVTLASVQALLRHPIDRVNKRINLVVSNSLFGAIASRYEFEACVIGPIDEEKVPADCFEAVLGAVYARSGYDKLWSFWTARLSALDSRELEVRGLKGTIDAMLLDLQHSIAPCETSIPSYMAAFIGALRPPPEESLQPGDFQQKCKMIGAAFVKASLCLSVYRTIQSVDEFLIVDQKAKKENVEIVAKTLGFPNQRQLKVFLGGLLLVNQFDDVIAMAEGLIIPAFELRKRRRRRSHHQMRETDIPEIPAS